MPAEVTPIQTSWHVITHLVDLNGPVEVADGTPPRIFAYTDDTSGIAPGEDLPWVPLPLGPGAYYTHQRMNVQDVFLLTNLPAHFIAEIPDHNDIEEYEEIRENGGFLPIIEASPSDGDEGTLEDAGDPFDEDTVPEGPLSLDAEARQMHQDSTIVLWVVFPGELNTEAFEAYLRGDYQGARFMLEAPGPTQV